MLKHTIKIKLLLVMSIMLLCAGTARSITISGTLSTTAPPAGPGYTTGAGIQQGRLFRGGNPPICPNTLTQPVFDTTPRTYHSYTFTPAISQCVTVTYNTPQQEGANIHIDVYNENGFDPNNVGNNLLTTPDLSTGTPPVPVTFSFPVTAGVPFTLDVFDIGGALSEYTFDIDVVVETYQFSFYQNSTLLTPSQTPYFTDATAGSSVSVTYTLGGYRGANPYSQPPASQRINCVTKAPIGAVTPIQTFPYDPYYNSYFDTYTTVWRTQANWSGTCRRLYLYFNDGTTKTRDYRFN